MGSIERFLTERGVRPNLPDRPLETYPKYWERSVRWRAAADEAQKIVETHGSLRALDLLNSAVGVPIYFTDGRYIPQLQQRGLYGFILVPGGCEWALKKEAGGQCAFCEFQESVDEVVGDLAVSHAEFVDLFRAGFAAMPQADMINVFTAGSFLNPGEIPLETQRDIAKRVCNAPHTSILRVESRVQYMVDEIIQPLTDILKPNGKTLDIAIGFETQDDELRNKALRKGMSRGGFMKAVQTAKRHGARVSAYVILMPVNSSEGYAIQECIDSIRFAFETGVDEVLLQARYSHYETIQCPKLWSIAKVLRETAHMGPVMLGKWEGEMPEPKVWPKNCGVCDSQMMQVLERWRDELRPWPLADKHLPACDCRKDWETAAADVTPPNKRGGLSVLP